MGEIKRDSSAANSERVGEVETPSGGHDELGTMLDLVISHPEFWKGCPQMPSQFEV